MKLTHFQDIPLDGLSGVLIDLDNTLYAYDPAHMVGLQHAHTHAGWECSYHDFEADYRQARHMIINRLAPQGACRSRLFAFQLMCENKLGARSYRLAGKLDEIYWSAFIGAITPDNHAVNFLQNCKQRGVAVCIVSDMTSHIQIRKLEQLGVSDYVDYLVTSEETGAEKPDKRIFMAGLSKLGAAVANTIMVGDDLVKDIQGAQSMGMTAYLVKGT